MIGLVIHGSVLCLAAMLLMMVWFTAYAVWVERVSAVLSVAVGLYAVGSTGLICVGLVLAMTH